MYPEMAKRPDANGRERLVHAAIHAFRRNGYDATSVDDICMAAGVSKGAFFHHFKSKEAIADASLAVWSDFQDGFARAVEAQQLADPVERLFALLDTFIAAMSDPKNGPPSCLAGTLAQEVAESNPRLRDATQRCFESGLQRIGTFIESAAAARGRTLDAPGLARLWMGTLQGGLILAKASQDPTVIAQNLRHVRAYLHGLFEMPNS